MTPKDKAKELIEKYKFVYIPNYTSFREVKQCVLIAVDEILASFNSFMDQRREFRHELEIDAERYWQQVRQEIELLKE